MSKQKTEEEKAKEAAAKKAHAEAAALVAPAKFKNTTKRNVFTTHGRVGSNCEITIPGDEGELTEGLERV